MQQSMSQLCQHENCANSYMGSQSTGYYSWGRSSAAQKVSAICCHILRFPDTKRSPNPEAAGNAGDEEPRPKTRAKTPTIQHLSVISQVLNSNPKNRHLLKLCCTKPTPSLHKVCSTTKAAEPASHRMLSSWQRHNTAKRCCCKL